MINKIYIRNFLSIKDAEVNLGKVNLIIGPNNSGKSNFLKAFEFLKADIQNFTFENYQKLINREASIQNNFNEKLIAIQVNISGHILFKEVICNNPNTKSKYFDVFLDTISFPITFIADNNRRFNKDFFEEIYLKNSISNVNISFDKFQLNTEFIDRHENTHYKTLQNTIIYNPNIEKIKSFRELDGKDLIVNSDASNLVSFLDNMHGEFPEIIKKIEIDLLKTVSNFVGLRFKKHIDDATKKMIGLSDTNNNIFWSDELSEGTLYFLSILAIIHQPNPPKLLLLEEPEKNVHPKRIHEIIDYLFQLSEDKDIQIIMTTHSPIVVDEFKDIPENVHLFDFIDNQTIIRNGADVIKKQNKERKAKNYSLLDLSNSTLGEQWLMGFLGGVPTE